MQIQYTKNLSPGRFELGTTLSYPIRSMMGARSSLHAAMMKNKIFTVEFLIKELFFSALLDVKSSQLTTTMCFVSLPVN